MLMISCKENTGKIKMTAAMTWLYCVISITYEGGMMMSKILVSGLINMETTLKVDCFPVEYSAVNYPFSGVETTVSGVGVNVAKAITSLGGKVGLLSLLGKDINGSNSLEVLTKSGISSNYILSQLKSTPQSVILYDTAGKRQINVDLKDIQESSYPEELFDKALDDCSIAVLCNINFSRPFLPKAREANKIVATDVHVISDIFDEYNRDFMRHANILFMSNEGINGAVENFVLKVAAEYDNDIIVIGLGGDGALLYVKKDNFIGKFPAVRTRKIVSTIGAGDALFSSFIYCYTKNHDPYLSLKKAMVFASYKIGEKGAADGFLSELALNRLYKTL